MVFALVVVADNPVHIGKFVAPAVARINLKRIETGFVPFNSGLIGLIDHFGVLKPEPVPEIVVHGKLRNIALRSGHRGVYILPVRFIRGIQHLQIGKLHGFKRTVCGVFYPVQVFQPYVFFLSV